jgi:dissimilatory sulfite reductase (desulfoviridin) alpha/beta subunit
LSPPSIVSAPRTPRPTFADADEIDAFVETLGRFERGELDADQWGAYRVARGAYSQRQDGVHMLRIKLPQGAADAAQLRAISEVASRFSRGWGHVTTRQNLQLHFLRPADLEPALRRLAEAGITTSGAGGNTVRNVVACPLAGVSPTELFDVTPYAEAVTRHFLRHPLASALPRKFKVAFEGCADDHVAAAIQDLGFRARLGNERGAATRGFAVTVAGGTSSLCTSGACSWSSSPPATSSRSRRRSCASSTPGAIARTSTATASSSSSASSGSMRSVRSWRRSSHGCGQRALRRSRSIPTSRRKRSRPQDPARRRPHPLTSRLASRPPRRAAAASHR